MRTVDLKRLQSHALFSEVEPVCPGSIARSGIPRKRKGPGALLPALFAFSSAATFRLVGVEAELQEAEAVVVVGPEIPFQAWIEEGNGVSAARQDQIGQ